MSVKFCFMCKSVSGKIVGCDHMTCPACDYAWCWICGCQHAYKNHECKNIWNPLVPEEIKGNSLKCIGCRLITAVFFTVFFFPFIVGFNISQKGKKFWKVPLFIGGLLIGFILYGIVVPIWILQITCFCCVFKIKIREPRWKGKDDSKFEFVALNYALSPNVILDMYHRCPRKRRNSNSKNIKK